MITYVMAEYGDKPRINSYLETSLLPLVERYGIYKSYYAVEQHDSALIVLSVQDTVTEIPTDEVIKMCLKQFNDCKNEYFDKAWVTEPCDTNLRRIRTSTIIDKNDYILNYSGFESNIINKANNVNINIIGNNNHVINRGHCRTISFEMEYNSLFNYGKLDLLYIRQRYCRVETTSNNTSITCSSGHNIIFIRGDRVSCAVLGIGNVIVILGDNCNIYLQGTLNNVIDFGNNNIITVGSYDNVIVSYSSTTTINLIRKYGTLIFTTNIIKIKCLNNKDLLPTHLNEWFNAKNYLK